MDVIRFRLPRNLALAACAGLLVWGCSTPVEPSAAPVATLTESIESESDVLGEATFVIRDAEALRRVWAQVFRGRRELPAVDFTKHMVVVVAMGRKPTAGYAVKITGATRRDRRGLIVHVSMVSPGAGCSVATVLTYPVAVSRLPAFDGPVRFDITRGTRDCTGR